MRNYARDGQHIAMPYPEVHLVVRFGPSTPRGLDIHAMGVRQSVHRKIIRRGQRTVVVRLRLGVAQAVLDVPASALARRIVALGDLWGDADTRRLCEQLADTHDADDAVAVLTTAIADRFATTTSSSTHAQLALAAAERLTHTNVNIVAADLGVSERHLRRVFHEIVGASPKAFAKLARFHRALGAAREHDSDSWASIAADAGYYDQAHLIADFHAIAGVTPRALLRELRADEADDAHCLLCSPQA